MISDGQISVYQRPLIALQTVQREQFLSQQTVFPFQEIFGAIFDSRKRGRPLAPFVVSRPPSSSREQRRPVKWKQQISELGTAAAAASARGRDYYAVRHARSESKVRLREELQREEGA